MRRLSVLLVLALLGALSGVAGAAGGTDVAQHQQHFIADLNAARWDPGGWGDAHGIDLGDVLPGPPLALNSNLSGSANFKATEMAQHDYVEHRSPVTGVWPNELAISWGYDLHPDLGVKVNTIESIAAGGLDPLPGFLSSYHVDHLMRWPHHEIGAGLGVEAGSPWHYYWSIQTGYRTSQPLVVTGTVFDDSNGDGAMDVGEGIPGITVTVTGVGSTLTDDGGGYSIAVPNGTFAITADGPGLRRPAGATIYVTDYNVRADFISGKRLGIVRDYQLCAGRAPTILGTSGDDVIYGTNGDDVIHGLSGSDIIYGLRGKDVICGGGGDDVIRGGGGLDRLIGGGGDDRLFGGWRNDTLKGGAADDLLNGGADSDTLQGGPDFDTCLLGEDVLDCEAP